MRGFIAKLQNPHVHLCSEDRLVVTAEVRGVRCEIREVEDCADNRGPPVSETGSTARE
jgi:hypothetical protein